jgi:hypothetical protein
LHHQYFDYNLPDSVRIHMDYFKLGQ